MECSRTGNQRLRCIAERLNRITAFGEMRENIKALRFEGSAYEGSEVLVVEGVAGRGRPIVQIGGDDNLEALAYEAESQEEGYESGASFDTGLALCTTDLLEDVVGTAVDGVEGCLEVGVSYGDCFAETQERCAGGLHGDVESEHMEVQEC